MSELSSLPAFFSLSFGSFLKTKVVLTFHFSFLPYFIVTADAILLPALCNAFLPAINVLKFTMGKTLV